MTFAFVILVVTGVGVAVSVVDGSLLAWVGDFGVWDAEAIVFSGEHVGHPAASLVVVLDRIPKAVGEVKLNRDE